MAEVKLDAGEIMQDLKISLRMPRAFGLRIKIVGILIRLAGAISPVAIEAKIEDVRPTAMNACENEDRRRRGMPVTTGSGDRPAPPRR